MSGQENFSWSKFWEGMLAGLNPILWVKDIVSLFNIRKLIIYAIIIAGVMAFGYYKGYQNRPLQVKLAYGREAKIEINSDHDYMHITESGNVYIKDKNGNIIKQITTKDIPALQKTLAPFALTLKPFVLAGGSINPDGQGNFEGGIGVQIARAYRFALDVFVTSFPAVYTGVSYQLTDNCYAGIGVGKSLKDFSDTRGIIYIKWKF